MNILFLTQSPKIREVFTERFLPSWEEFQLLHPDWIAQRANTSYPIDLNWYHDSFLWDKMGTAFPAISFSEALAFLENQDGNVLFMSEKGKKITYGGQQFTDFVGEADARELAAEIKHTWFEDYRLTPLGLCNPDAFLPDDLYIFDRSMGWCVVFTHETTLEDPDPEDSMQEAESRLCLIYRT